MDMNLTMAVFVLPMILEFHGNSSGAALGKGACSLETGISKVHTAGGRILLHRSRISQKFCYITTAVCETFGKPDDCYELRLLRTYRDGYLAGTRAERK